MDGMFKIKKVTLLEINNKGTFTSVNNTGSWNYNTPESITLYDGSNSGAVTAGQTLFTIDDILVIPQAISNSGAALKIEYEQKSYSSTDSYVAQEPVTVNLGGTSVGNSWLIGKHYSYTITFSADKILITPSVESWTEVSGDDITVQ